MDIPLVRMPPQMSLWRFGCLSISVMRTPRSRFNGNALRNSVRHSAIRLDAVLAKLPLTLGACSRLEVGQVLELPGTESGRLSLYAETMNGNVAISQGELGVWKGHRALKLSEPLLDSFIKEIAGI